MADEPRATPSQDVETEHERRTRQLGELLQETRVAMPGVQVLFGFLLTAVSAAVGFAMLRDRLADELRDAVGQG